MIEKGFVGMHTNGGMNKGGKCFVSYSGTRNRVTSQSVKLCLVLYRDISF